MATQKLNIDIVARDRTRQALGGVQGALGRLRKSVFSIQSAFIGIGAGLVTRNLVNTGKNLENLRTRLKFLLKDTNEGAKAFDNMVKFASKVPFSLEEIQAGSGILATVTDNAEDLQNMLEITGNVAAVTGLDFRTASEQIQRSFSAGIGAADLFREKGVRNMLGFKAGATVSIEETVQAFEKVFGRDGRFGKATDELAETFEGTLSMIGDKVFNFKKVLLEAGFFEELKRQFGDLDKFLQDNAEDINKIAIAVGKNLADGMVKVVNIGKDLIPTLEKIGGVLKSIVDGFMTLPPYVKEVGLIGAFVLGKKGVAALAGISFLLDKISDFVENKKIELGILDVDNMDHVRKKIAHINEQLKNGNKIIERQIFLQNGVVGTVEDYVNLTAEDINSLKQKKAELEHILFLNKLKTNTSFEHTKILHEDLKINKQITEEYQKQQEKVIDIFEHQKKLHEGFNELPKDLEGIGGALEGFGEGMKSEFDVTMFERFKEAGQSSLQSLKSSISDFIMTGKMSFDTLKTAIIRSIVEAMVGAAVTAAIKKSTMLFKFSAIKEGLISAYKAGAKALASVPFPLNLVASGLAIKAGMKLVDKIKGFEKGGAVAKGQPILVGERGPELFMPNQTGQITQSSRGTGGGAVNVNFNINAVDASGFEELLFRSRGTIAQLINNAVNERGREAII